MGLFFSRETENGATISVWEITESENELLDLCSVPSEELEELQFTKSTARRKELLAVRALLNEMFGGKVYLGHHDNGRPFLQNSLTEISISHTARFACIITHPEESVGIDIESVKRNFLSVEKRALSDDEREDVSEKNRNTHLAIYWSAKEAVFKRMSRSDVDFARQIFIKKFTPRDKGEITAIYTDNDGHEEEFELNYEIFNDHVMVWIVG